MTLLLVVLAIGILAYFRLPLIVWTAAAAAVMYHIFGMVDLAGSTAWWLFIAVAAVLNIPFLRRPLLTNWLLRVFRKILPEMSQTEREALEAGNVWWDAQLFSGNPRWGEMLALPAPKLSDEERAFVDGPVEELCKMLDDWKITHELGDLPPEVWQFIKDKRFFAMIIPKSYGGLEFSALAHSTVVQKIATRSITAAVTVMVPNSLGPGELLLHYGTEEQKKRYLPGLARGEEVPCFALTGPEAGSDAGAIPDTGIICKGQFEGKEVIGIRLNWAKRYITLGPVATVLGLAFKLYDPEHLMGEVEDLGITCALIPTNTPGVTIGDRHAPLDMAFQNGPNFGKDVFIPIDWIIGGWEWAGKGWRMLMESLAAGRSISLPALSVGGGKLASRATGAYSRVRKQFKVPIARFEGVEEVLSMIAGYTYMMDSARTMTAQAVDMGIKPSVISAIVKYNLTERMRKIINGAVDIQGGSAICMGPRNYLARIYQSIPIAITVEGANILTRSLIIYGQGAIRCHPYVFTEMEAAKDDNWSRASRQFDKAIIGHIGFTISNMVRALWLGLTGARLKTAPGGKTKRYYQKVSRLSAAFAFVSDVAMLTLGGELKRMEKLSGRLADVLSQMYLVSATLKRFNDQGKPKEDLPLLRWACDDALYTAQQALDSVLRNYPIRPFAWFMRLIVFPLGRRQQAPSDKLGHKAAQILLEPSPSRDRLTADIFVPKDNDEPLGRLEYGMVQTIAADKIEKRLRSAVKAGKVKGRDMTAWIDNAVQGGVINGQEADALRESIKLRAEIVAVDAFNPSVLTQRK